MKCPRCQNVFSAKTDAAGTVVCPGCGARLRSRAPAAGPSAAGAEDDAPGSVGAAKPAGGRRNDPAATLPPGTPLRDVSRAPDRAAPAERAAERSKAADRAPAAVPAATDPMAAALREVLSEVRSVRRMQEQILGLLQSRRRPAADHGDEDSPFERGAAPAVPAVRSRRRKTVLLIDDDETTRQEALAAMQAAEVPVSAVADGNSGLAAIAHDRPDVIVLELEVGGPMAGKDVVNMIKATMEWVDIPIVLYTRAPIESQKEARQIHGADELVLKAPGSAEALVARVIALFRRP